jgi:hypothetical protein
MRAACLVVLGLVAMVQIRAQVSLGSASFPHDETLMAGSAERPKVAESICSSFYLIHLR